MSRRNNHIFEESEEAVESQEHVEDEEGLPQSEEEGEDLLENAERDYEKINELDIYEDEGVDQEMIELNPEARKKAEKELNRRDKIYEAEEVEDYIDFEEDEEAELRRRR